MRVAAVVITVLLALVWNAAEVHYRNCVTAAEARTSPPPVSSALSPDVQRELERKYGSGGELRQDAVARCSRLPF